MENLNYLNMVKVLEEIKILSPSTPLIEAKLSAWAKGFELINSYIEQTIDNFFIKSCDEQTLKKFEKITGSTALGTIEDRKNKILAKVRLYENPFSKTTVLQKLSDIGFVGELVEGENNLCTLRVQSLNNLSQEEFEQVAKQTLPINVNIAFEYL